LFLNGLFNDPFQTFFSYLGVLFLLKRRHAISLAFFSLGASIKMSGLLWAPGVAAYLISTIGIFETVKTSWSGILVQLLVALPFLSHPWHYIHRSFELDRQFTWFNVSFFPAALITDLELEISTGRSILFILLLVTFIIPSHPLGGLLHSQDSLFQYTLLDTHSPFHNSILGNCVLPLPTL
jgi:hypothetical protein